MISSPFARRERIETASAAPDERRDSAVPDDGRATATRRRMQARRPGTRHPRTRRRHDRCPLRP
ncbi:hypothetical protein EMIT0111MI5_290044 [Burkholderia sp. IT-111MI5]